MPCRKSLVNCVETVEGINHLFQHRDSAVLYIQPMSYGGHPLYNLFFQCVKLFLNFSVLDILQNLLPVAL